MPRPRQPTDTLKKHISKAEAAERRSQEFSVPKAEKATPPKWLGRGFPDDVAKALKAEFRKIGKQLIDVGLYTDLDADTLAHYVVARHQWELASVQAEIALSLGIAGGKPAGAWSAIQDRYFAAARKCAGDLGLTLSARCKLIIPEKPAYETEPADEFSRILRQRMAGSA